MVALRDLTSQEGRIYKAYPVDAREHIKSGIAQLHIPEGEAAPAPPEKPHPATPMEQVLGGMTVAELRAYAESTGVPAAASMRKPELIAALMDAGFTLPKE